MKNLLLLVFLTLAIGCNKPNPNPETLDPIYLDLEKRAKEASSEISATEKQLEEFRAAAKKVEPQTGQIKYATKRVYETQARLNKLIQKQAFLVAHTKSRKTLARKKYLEAFNKKQPWPDPNEYKTYLSQRALEEAPRVWSVENRKELLGVNQKPKPAEKSEH